jgi:hypothetical protein
VKKSNIVEKLVLGHRILAVSASLDLAATVSAHPEIQEVYFINVKMGDFGAIVLAIQQNPESSSTT